MKKLVYLIVVAIAALGPVTATAQNAFHAKTDKNGFYKVLDCPTSPSYFKATSEQNEDGSYNVKIYHGRQLAQTIKCEVTGEELYFIDANFDGDLDIVVGPATARNYSTILLWSDKKNEFVPTGVELNGYFLVNPKAKMWVGLSSGGASSTYYSKYIWNGNKLEVSETLMEFSDPKEYADYGVTTKYTLIKGDDYYSTASVGCVKQRTNKRVKLPKDWQRILNSFDNM